MCKFDEYSNRDNDENQRIPKVLRALIRMKMKAENEFNLIQDRLERIKDMETIVNKLVSAHLDSDDYVDYLFIRAEQLSSHLETYKKIIGKIDIGEDIRQTFRTISYEFIEYLKRKIEFKTLWMESMQTIDSGRELLREKIAKLNELNSLANEAVNNDEYFQLKDLRLKFDEELLNMNNLLDNCFQCGQQSKELSNLLSNKLTQLEADFQQVVRSSVNKLNEIKCNTKF